MISSILFFLMSSTAYAADPVSEFRGAQEIEKILSGRIIEQGNSLDFGLLYLGGDQSLKDLMGFPGRGVNEKFRNGKPNSVNMLIYFLVFQAFARDLSRACDEASQGELVQKLQPTFKDTLVRFCTWPSIGDKPEDNLFDLWVGLMSFDAPYDEFMTWKDFFLSAEFVNKPAKEVLSSMIFAVLMNPHFVLKQ
jgi:hypothetical protein